MRDFEGFKRTAGVLGLLGVIFNLMFWLGLLAGVIYILRIMGVIS